MRTMPAGLVCVDGAVAKSSHRGLGALAITRDGWVRTVRLPAGQLAMVAPDAYSTSTR